MKMPLLLISPKNGLKFLLIAKGGCFECYAVIRNKTEYYRIYIERLFAPSEGWVSALFSFPGISEKYWGLEVRMCKRKCMPQISQANAASAISGKEHGRVVVWAKVIAITWFVKHQRFRLNVMAVPMDGITLVLGGVRRKFCKSLASDDMSGNKEFQSYERAMKKAPGSRLSKRPIPRRCKECEYHQPKWKYRSCYYVRCP